MTGRRFFAVLLVVCLLCTFSASASKYGIKVDTETMKMLEAQSTCPVRVTEKKVVLGTFDVKLFSHDGAASLVITVTNGSDTTLTAVDVGFIALKEDDTTTDTKSNLTYSPMETAEVKHLARSDLSLAPGESCVISTRVDYDYFKGVRAMVCQYTAADGSVVVNPDYKTWEMYAFGLSSTDATELD